MNTARIGNVVRTHDLRVVQEDRSVLLSDQDRVSILRMYKATVSEISGVERPSQPVPCQCRQKGSRTVGEVMRKEVGNGGESLICRADASQPRSSICSFRQVCQCEP